MREIERERVCVYERERVCVSKRARARESQEMDRSNISESLFCKIQLKFLNVIMERGNPLIPSQKINQKEKAAA